jgi:hypothetical protein
MAIAEARVVGLQHGLEFQTQFFAILQIIALILLLSLRPKIKSTEFSSSKWISFSLAVSTFFLWNPKSWKTSIVNISKTLFSGRVYCMQCIGWFLQ